MPVNPRKSVIRIPQGGNVEPGWYHASPKGNILNLRRIPAADKGLPRPLKIAAEDIDGEQYTYTQATDLTRLPVHSFKVEWSEAWALVVRLLEAPERDYGLHEAIDRAIFDSESPWEPIQQLCIGKIAERQDRWLVSGEDGNGVLYVSKRGGPDFRARVDKNTLRNEEGLSYALFNSRNAIHPYGYSIISYEAFLLRPKQTVKCDLVAYSEDASSLLAVEVKQIPDSSATRIEHGLLQAMCYGYILKCCNAKDSQSLGRQIGICLEKWCSRENGVRQVSDVAYVLAAPKEYFTRSLRIASKEWIQGVIDNSRVRFEGFWVIDGEVQGEPTNGSSKVIPTIDECNVTRAEDVKTLSELCGVG